MRRNSAALRENRAAAPVHPMLPVSGIAQGDVTPVGFFGYQRGFRKRSRGHVMDLPRSDANLPVGRRELPARGPGSAAITPGFRIIIPDYVRTSCSRLRTGAGAGFGPMRWRRAPLSDRFGGRWTLSTAQSTRSSEQDEIGA